MQDHVPPATEAMGRLCHTSYSEPPQIGACLKADLAAPYELLYERTSVLGEGCAERELDEDG